MAGTIRRGKITRADLALYDGRTSSYSRPDATGGTTTGVTVGNDVDVLQVFGSGTSRSRSSCASAVARIGSAQTTLAFAPGTWTIDASLTIPSNFTCYVPAGCVFSVDSGVTLTFSGDVVTDDPESWYTGAGTVVVSREGAHGGVWHRTSAERDQSITPSDYSYPPLHVHRYGAVGNGTTDDRAAIQKAIDVASEDGGTILFKELPYLISSTSSSDSYADGLVVPYSSQNSITKNVVLRGAGRSTRLMAGDNTMVVIRYSASNGGVRDLTIDNNSKTGCIGLGVMAEDITQTSTRVDQNYNVFSHLWIEGTFTEGIYMKAGPDVAGADSGCWYNTFIACHVRKATRGLLMAAPNNAGGSPCNRNRFFSCRWGETGMNTGVQITEGNTNEFHACAFEGISTGTSPQVTPTAIVIDTNTSATESNRFFGCTFESCTRDVENENQRSEFYGCNIFNALWTADPLISLGGYDASQTPQVVPAYVFQTNSQISGYDNGVINLRTGCGGIRFLAAQSASSNANTLDDYEEGSWTPVLAGASTAGTQTYTSQVGRYEKIGRLVIASFTILLSAKDAAMAGSVYINGIPFTNLTGVNAHAAVAVWGDINVAAGYTQVGAYIVSGEAFGRVLRSGDGVAHAAVDSAEIGATSYIEGTFIYRS